MVLKVISANQAVAEAAKLAKPKVIPVYPITPQTSISEYLAKFVADGELKAEYIRVESEHSAMSACVGASGAGVRVFTATSSQGLALMHEIVYAAAGLRNPIVMANANRALSAPLSIWNDQQDSIAERDSGWMQIYVESGQEALDSVLLSYRVSEDRDVLLPSMVCLDGFILTHTVEPVDIPSQEDVDSFLPEFQPQVMLDPDEPMSLGTFTDPDYYMEARYEVEKAMERSRKIIERACREFSEMFGREYGLVEEYRCEDAEIILVAMGSVCSTLREVIDELRDKGKAVGLLKVRVHRPFPAEEIKSAVRNASKVAVLDKNITFSVGGALYTEISALLRDREVYGFIVGLGGRDITPAHIEEIVRRTENPERSVTWIGLKEESE
ncbi:pyruvate oxidoreductase, alpha subunit [Methanothermobacter thermautotrophicus str. Delta H]|uniref:Pyruvate synthase subunit PorA n=1 Tax=Methanothermobacter thermautotrophicus (strain ATCC 29096 / DSM 1053 / JCM 10044 / NBRC 100330 / Delta H) TaxID=187420 RepID=PORA_METTH|nr:pyruvate synthase subunit PorA [Methanothermobacter thermautotrophicus]P56810.2 RecName: Full=Pyruvate synthase subunit PorA; AltName: Full=Pyruvate oxidoreductase alpha chain; Short=POR; AltName: Full=Pyruvic-ferredoxin oxidoreductase subunit alpha [Methanothermobacter thermautotrophicus str. Delta H]AAB86209.1 pyruvate oxidoreductase, alpha subunit [Methanothermobacter thermautotrophicus str. Delta H]WBF06215.1 pyruvate ferredoxin oxidoreductase [Methanothermobacter thermautotrophicus]